MTLENRKLGRQGLEVSAIGLGCMGMSQSYGPYANEELLARRQAAQGATEKICHRMPTFVLEGNLVHFAAFKGYVGVDPPVQGDADRMKELARYVGPKGNLRFPLDEPIPYHLVTRTVKAWVQENQRRAEERRSKAKGSRAS